MNVSYFSQVETGKANLTYLNLPAIAAALFMNPVDLPEHAHWHAEQQIKAQAADMLSQPTPERLRMLCRLLRVLTRCSRPLSFSGRNGFFHREPTRGTPTP